MRSAERWIARSTDRVCSISSSFEPGCCRRRSCCFRSLLRCSVGLELLYFAVRVGGVAATLLGGEPGPRERQQRPAPSGGARPGA